METEICEKCGGEITQDKFKDAICKDGNYYTVYLKSCAKCMAVADSGTWSE